MSPPQPLPPPRRPLVRELLNGPRPQASLRVAPVDDPHEREADRVAEAVTAPASAPASTPASTPGEERVAREAGPSTGGELGGAEIPAGLERRLRSLSGGGSPLPPALGERLGERFGADFSGVRIHTGAAAGEMADALGARAFTLGSDIAFAPGEYRPGSRAGERLLAHELTHVVQQRPVVQRETPQGAPGSTPDGLSDIRESITRLEAEQRLSQAREALREKYESLHKEVTDSLWDVSSQEKLWTSFYLDVGSAFAIAHHMHTRTLEAQSRADAVRMAVMMAVLSVTATGAFAYMSTMAQKSDKLEKLPLIRRIRDEETREGVVNATEDAAQLAVDKLLTTVNGASGPTGGATIPLVFQNDHLKPVLTHAFRFQQRLTGVRRRIESEKDRALGRLTDADGLAERVTLLDAEFSTLRREVGQVLTEVRGSGIARIPPDYDRAALARETERGIWAEWVKRLEHRVLVTRVRTMPYQGVGVRREWYKQWETVYDSPGGEIEERLASDEMGITKAAGVEFGWLWNDTEDLQKLVAWGKRYRPRMVVPRQ